MLFFHTVKHKIRLGSLGIQGIDMTPFVRATLVVAPDWAGTRPARTVRSTPRNPNEPALPYETTKTYQ